MYGILVGSFEVACLHDLFAVTLTFRTLNCAL